jgi:hypothetical protein
MKRRRRQGSLRAAVYTKTTRATLIATTRNAEAIIQEATG